MFHAVRISKKAVWALLAMYTVFLLYMMFLGLHRTVYAEADWDYRLNLVPFDTIHRYVFHANAFTTGMWAINLFGNIGVFVPYGLLLPILLRGCRSLIGMLLTFYAGLFVAELMQLLLRVGSFDVDDFILNGLGASAGYALFAGLRGRKRGRRT